MEYQEHMVPDQQALRMQKEKLLQQHGRVLWMCGLSGSGKTTLAERLDQSLTEMGFLCQVIDGDVVRKGLNKGLGYSITDRIENLRRVAELTRMFLQCGVITVVAFISPTRESRSLARSIVGSGDFLDAYINSPLEVCEKRDTKGLYRLARKGLIRDFTGIDSPFEVPDHPGIEIRTDRLTIEECTAKLMDYIIPYVAFNKTPWINTTSTT